jgi:hypothetical protein
MMGSAQSHAFYLSIYANRKPVYTFTKGTYDQFISMEAGRRWCRREPDGKTVRMKRAL